MSSIDLESAIAAHMGWAKKLRDTIDGHAENDISVADVHDHTACVLGRYLYGTGNEYSLFKQYHDLLEVHRRFHKTASEIVQLHKSKEDDRAISLLDGEFQAASDRICELLRLLIIDGY